ncbi:MAG TPA: tetratricopeptide repeat protein [Polyangiales bacterium]|nr:tetratricopeptide repeat protein [Polyangiales bacterium]
MFATILPALMLALGVIFTSAPVSAQDDDVEPPEYRALVSEALSEFDAGRYSEARALFLRAHTLLPSARTLRGLGLASFELRQYGAAIEYLQRALAAQSRPLTGELKLTTENVLKRSFDFVGRYTPQLEPASARLHVDGASVDPAALLILDIGSHVVTADAADYLAETRPLQVLGGEEQVLPFLLTRVAPMVVAAPPAPGPRVELTSPSPVQRADVAAKRPLYRNPWLWTGVAAVAAAVVIAVTVPKRERHEVGDTALTPNTPVGAVVRALEAP